MKPRKKLVPHEFDSIWTKLKSACSSADSAGGANGQSMACQHHWQESWRQSHHRECSILMKGLRCKEQLAQLIFLL